jgi:hypothetical protein
MGGTNMTALVRSTIRAALVCALTGAVVAPALAEDYYDVILANRLVCRLRDPAGYGSVSERGSAVEKSVVEALSVEDVGHPRMSIKTSGGAPAIYIGGTFLTQVRSGDAAGTGASVSSLARQWLAAFEQQFPRAEPVTKIGRGGGGAGSGSGVSPDTPPVKKPVVVPEEDKALVEEVGRLLTDARALSEEDFAAKGEAVAAEATALVWRASTGATSTCADFGTLTGKDQAMHSTLNGLKFARDLSDQAFEEQSTLVALTIVKRVRIALVPPS